MDRRQQPRPEVRAWIALACASLSWAAASCAAVAARTRPEAAAAVRIPFTLTAANNLSVRATLNGTDAVELMFHTAVDSVSLTRAAIARLSSFRADESVAVQSWGGTAQARHSTGNTLAIGAEVWRDLDVTEDENSGPGTDGKFGPNLFAGKIVEIDFDARELLLHATLPPSAARFERLDLVQRDGLLFVAGELGVGASRHATEFLLHTGFGGTALLAEPFLRARGLDTALVTLREDVLHDSYGNPVRTRQVRLPSLHLGALTFADVPVGTFAGMLGSQSLSLLGGDLLKRCNWILDPEHGHLYVAPSRLEDAPFGP